MGNQMVTGEIRVLDNFTSVLSNIKSIPEPLGGKLFDFGQNASEIIPYFHEYTI